MKTSVVVLSIGVVGLLGLAYYMSKKSTATVSSTGRLPINALPARTYALNNNFNPSGQPPPVTFTPASGVSVIEGLFGAFGSGGNSGNTSTGSGQSTDPTVGSSDNWDGSGSGGSGSGGAGTDVGWSFNGS